MFGIWDLKHLRMASRWHVLVPDFEVSTDEFYQMIKSAIEAKRVPDLEISVIEFREGGVMSARRRYLRLRRERLVFDVCSAPFGTSWFFSCRAGEIPMHLKVWEIVAMAAAISGFLLLHMAIFGINAGSAVFLLNAAAVIFLLNCLTATSLYGLDAILLRTPVVGAFYERYFRGNSYFREDTRQMYLQTVDGLVRGAVEEVAGQTPGGVKFMQDDIETNIGLFGWIRELFRRPWSR